MPVKRLSERGKARKIDDLPVDLLKNKGNCGGVHNLFSKWKIRTRDIRRKQKNAKENRLYFFQNEEISRKTGKYRIAETCINRQTALL
jgi:hypothetical protein